MFSARLNTDFRGLAGFLIHKYCTHLYIYTALIKLLYKCFGIILLKTMNRKFVEYCLANFQRYYQSLPAEVLLVIFDAFVFVIVFLFFSL